MPDKRILPEKEKTIQKTSGNDIMYAKAKVNMVQIPDARACMERTNLLHVSAPASPGSRRVSGHLPERASETLDG